jgi:DNA-binding GntR family transcriptional regulator
MKGQISNDRDAKLAGREATSGAFDHAVNTLTQAIRDGVYRAGDRLVESRLARELGVSRSTLREVLRRLSSEGLIRLQPNRGAIVRSFSRADISELLEVRELLEGFAASLAARNATVPERQEQIRARLERIAQLRQRSVCDDYPEHNQSFHDFIVELGGNHTLAQQIRQLQLPFARSWYFGRMQPADRQRSVSEHEQILLALLDGDAALAGQLMSAHIRRTRKLVESLPDEMFDNLDSRSSEQETRRPAADLPP